MANHDVLLGQNKSGSLGYSQPIVLNRNHNIVLAQNHGKEIGQAHEQDTRLGQSHESQGDNVHEYEQENGLGMEDKHEHEIQEVHLHEGTIELDMSDHNDLGVFESQEIDENMELAVIQDDDMGMDSVHNMSLHQGLVLAPSHVMQQRTLAISPSYELHVGQEFPDVRACRRALRDTAIALHFEMQTIKLDKTRFTAKCASEGCSWRIHAAKLPGVPTFTIRTITDSHTCGGIAHLGHQQASGRRVANSVEERIKENPNYKPKEILEEIHRVHSITLSYKQAWRGKKRIMAAMRGSFEEGYRLLPQYCEQVKQTNLGSIASVYGNPIDNCFQRLFISFQASIYGFLNACRPLLGLDKTFLKSKYLGTLLLATGFDGMAGFSPWPLGLLMRRMMKTGCGFSPSFITFSRSISRACPGSLYMSDRQRGIVDGVEANFPTAFHGYCMRHLSESFRKEYNNSMLVNLLWEAAHALTVIEFEAKIIEIEEISQEAAYWVRRHPPHLWDTAYFEGKRFGQLTATILDSLNMWIGEASGLPIIQVTECIRRQLMTWFNEHRETSMQWTSILVPSVERRVAEALECAHTYQVLRVNEAEFEVISQEGTNIVDIWNRCCLCQGWQRSLPCTHAVSALLSCRQNVHRFTERCFTVATYRKTYSQTVHPIPDKILWRELSEGDPNANNSAEMIVHPPKSLRPPGILRKSAFEPKTSGV